MNETAHHSNHIVIDPITRLEGHGKIDIFLDDQGNVSKAFYQIPELRGFEIFTIGKPAEEMPQITSRICGVCPMAHHMAATKALDDLYHVEPTPTAKKVRELIYNAFMLEDHALHVYILSGPDFIVGPDAPKATRNVVGVINTVGIETGKLVISTRRRIREFITSVAGKIIHPVFGLPGGVSKGITSDQLPKLKELAADGVEFAKTTLNIFQDIVLSNKTYLDLITSETYTHRTHAMGLVDERNFSNYYDGKIRVVNPAGKEIEKFPVQEYLTYIAEHVEPWSYVKFPYLKKIGWNGFVDGAESGVYSVAPLARLNVAAGMSTPLAQQAYEKYLAMLGKPVHHTLANHWARVIEMLNAAERMAELANDPEILGKDIRQVPTQTPTVGIGVVEAPRGTLIHHYETNERGIIQKANLIVATAHNAARIGLSVEKAAKGLIKNGVVNDGLLNMVEMAFRAYDPCNACATHTLPGQMPLEIRLRNADGTTLQRVLR